MGKRPPVFLREATGLVRELRVTDVASFNMANMTFGIGIAYILFYAFLAPGGEPLLATLVGTLMFVPLATIGAMVTSAIPRSAADYVFISRAIHPVVGYIENFVAVFWVIFWEGATANWVFTTGFAPFFSLVGSVQGLPAISGLASIVSTNSFILVAGICLLLLFGVVLSVNKRVGFTILVASIVAGVVSVALMLFVLATSTNAEFISRFNLYSAPFAGTADYYHQLISQASIPQTGFSWTATVNMIPFVAWSFMYYAAQPVVGGEIKNVRKNSYVAMFLTILIAVSFTVAAVYLSENVMGLSFLDSIAAMSGTSAYRLPIIPYYSFLVGVLVTNPILLWIMELFFVGWDIALMLLCFIMVPRYLLASSMDRITPSVLANVSDRFHTPYVATSLVAIVACIMLVIYTVFIGFFATLSAVLSELVGIFLLLAVAAIIFPFRSSTKAMFEASPVAFRIAGIPVISILGCFSTAVLLLIGYMFAMNSMYGINSFYSLLAIFLVPIVGALILTASYVYHKKQGLDMRIAFKQLPPE